MGRSGTGNSRRAVVLLGLANAPFGLANRFEVLVHPPLVLRAEIRVQPPDLRRDRIEQAAIHLHLAQPVGSAVAVAEQPLENRARIALHRVGRRRRPPGDGVHVGATVAGVAVADDVGGIEGELERCQGGRRADLPGRDLIGGGAHLHIGPLGPLGMHAAQPPGARTRVVSSAVAERLELAMGQVGHHDHLLAERRERLERGRPLELAAHTIRRPGRVVGTVRDVDEGEPARGARGRAGHGRQRRHHGVQQRQRHRGSHSPQHRPARQGLLRDDHGCTLRIRNGLLSTTPRISDEKR